MATEALTNIKIWNRFFSDATPGVDFEAYVHCENRKACAHNIADDDLRRNFHMIDTVPSEWCSDLVTPMNALLAAALHKNGSMHAAGNDNDKFIFISDTTVPLKSFEFVRHKLTVKDGRKSNFCVQEWPKWALYESKYVVAKHSQWMILSRAHALNAIDMAERFTPKQMMRQMVPLQWAGSQWVAPIFWEVRKSVAILTHSPVLDGALTLVVPAVRGCADEFWHLAATIGALNPKSLSADTVDQEASQSGLFDDLTGGPLTMQEEYSQHLQGQCDTFALVDSMEASELEPTNSELILKGNGTSFGGQSGFLGLRPHIHAGKFIRVSGESLHALGSSDYLFARKMDNTTKFVGDMNLIDAFDSIIFNPPSASVA